MKSEANTDPVEWDKEDIYDAEIAPLMTEIIEICRREKIPMFASFSYAHNEGETSRCSTHLDGPNGFDEAFSECLVRARRSNASLVALTVTTRTP